MDRVDDVSASTGVNTAVPDGRDQDDEGDDLGAVGPAK
jgi:hypothetical protein